MSTRDSIKRKCEEIKNLLLQKNAKYGDAAINPLNIFSQANASSSIKIRIDEKLKRIQNSGLVDDTEDTLKDIVGYMILLMIAKENESNDIQERLRQNEPAPRQFTTSTVEDSGWEITYDHK
tara:strand:+ start:1004 stop:1369 length:366 start_codon:yes stop_codon:yes gene_type:complete